VTQQTPTTRQASSPLARVRPKSRVALRASSQHLLSLFRRALCLCAAAAVALAHPVSAQQPLSLHDAIAMAENSPQALAAAAQISAAQGSVRQAGLGLNPRIYLSSEDIRPWASDFSFANNTEDYGYLGQTAELAGKRSKRVGVATADLRRTEAEVALGKAQIAGRVAQAYWGAALALGLRDLLAQDLKAVDDLVRYHKQRVDAGAMRGVDLLRMQIERDRISMALDLAERDLEVARVDLFRQIGRKPDPTIVLSESLSTPLQPPPSDIEAAVVHRADIVAARETVASAAANLRLQHAIAVPDPDILGGYKRNSGFDTLFASVQVPLPFRNRNQGEIARADANLRLARARLEQAELGARADIAAAQTVYEHQLHIAQGTLPDMRSRARKNLEILDDAYRTGGVDLLRYIDAERTEIDVEVNALRILADLRQSAVRLQLAFGEPL